jgi:hypothetical protein
MKNMTTGSMKKGKDLDESCSVLIEVLSWNIPEAS